MITVLGTLGRFEKMGLYFTAKYAKYAKAAGERSGSGLRIGQIYSDAGGWRDTTISKLGDFLS